ncbi:hypothetical protein [Variovorax sp. YR752]|nr:hypothetical protein [Variovorax sp. YR752]
MSTTPRIPLQRFYLLHAWGGYVALFCTRSPKYGRACASLAYRASGADQ